MSTKLQIQISSNEWLHYDGYSKSPLMCSETATPPVEAKVDAVDTSKSLVVNQPKKSNVISRLTINVSNRCNLDCSYCYAKGGDYGLSVRSIDSKDILDKLASLFVNYEISNIMYFGGEPSLNIEEIIEICEFVTRAYNAGLISKMPSFSAISNFYGTRQFEKFLVIAKRYGLNLTASIDGPQKIHDLNRYTKGKSPSFSVVAKNFSKSIGMGVKPFVECTYSRDHINSDISVCDLMNFFNSEFGLKETHISPDIGMFLHCSSEEYNKIISHYCEAINSMVFRDDGVGFSLGYEIFNAIQSEDVIEKYCPALEREISIGPDGNYYPCFMFTGKDQFRLNNDNTSSLINNISSVVNKDRPACDSCWAKPLCSGCVGVMANGESIYSKRHCNFVKATRQEAIVSVYELETSRKIDSHRRCSLRNQYLEGKK